MNFHIKFIVLFKKNSSNQWFDNQGTKINKIQKK
jgi:hypothetical protein